MKIKFISKITLLFIAIFCEQKLYSQSLYPPKIETPNSTSLGKFGEIPVNLFTGTPNISIPLHTLIYGNIQVPISLRYHPGSVKPSQQPGWVGSGWDLQSIGSVSRQQRGLWVDEYYAEGHPTPTATETYYPFPGQTSTPGGTTANLPNWNTQSQFFSYFTSSYPYAEKDIEADEFSFNVLGYSGKFYYSGTNKGWQVVSDQNIKVEIQDFYNRNEIVAAIKQFNIPDNTTNLGPAPGQSRMFGGFILTAPNGMKFYFGGKDGGIPDAVEFSCPRNSTAASLLPVFTANTWLLKKIKDVNGNEITFNYNRTYPTCNLFINYGYFNGACDNGNSPNNLLHGSSSTFSLNKVEPNKLSGIFQWPMYLSSISSPNENVSFNKSDAVCKAYTQDQLTYLDITNKVVSDVDNLVLGLSYPDNINKLRWQQLDKVIVTDKMTYSNGYNNYQPNKIKQFKFNYSNSVNARLSLLGLEQLDKNNNVIGAYSFNYNSGSGNDLNTNLSNNSIYPDGNYTDHWGYYNGIDINFAGPTDIYYRKTPSATFVTAGLLNKITYPTGGYTSFTWEPNDYSRLVDIDRQSYSNVNSIGGGARIAEIKSYANNNELSLQKKYYYKSNYSAGINPATLTSSGVINGNPQYLFQLVNRAGLLPVGSGSGHTVSVVYLNGVGNFGYTGQGAPVGYDEVTEVNADGSYTKNYFTNYGVDLNGVSHWDKPPLGYCGWDPNNDTYFPRASLERERGLPTSIQQYNSSGILLSKENTVYRTDNERFNNYVHLIDHNGSYGSPACANTALALATARPEYIYTYYPISVTNTTYDQQGQNPLIQTTTFTYNSNNLIKTKVTDNSKGETNKATYTYTSELSDAVSLAMTAAHMYTPINQEEVVIVGTPDIPLKKIKTNYYQPYTGVFVPQTIQQQIGNNSLVTLEQVTKNDAKGNVQEIINANGLKEVYIWGCNSEYILAKIVGADYTSAAALINQAMLDQAGVGYNNYSDIDIRNELNKLRIGLPNALVTTYTYKCGVGISSVTDPNGITNFYIYDDFNRLTLILDKDKKVLKKYCYNFSGEAEDCESIIYYNDQQQNTFTKNNGCALGTISPSYIYTVPANTYSSLIDKAAANQLAIDALNISGQAYVNTLPCLAPINGLNLTTAPWTITISNASNTFNQIYSLYPGSTLNFLENIPVGIYNINIVPMYSGSVTSPVNLFLNGSTYSGTTFTLTSVSINTATGITLQNPPSSGTCSFSMTSGFISPTNNITNNGSTATFYMVFYSQSTLSPGNSYYVTTINGSCRPSTTRILSYFLDGRNWTITIYANGNVYFQLDSGSPSVNSNSAVATPSINFNL